MDLDALPDEVLEEVFLRIPPKQLFNLTYVSRRFNDVISKSKRVMEALPIIWNDKKTTIELKRKYRSLIILNLTQVSDALLTFVGNHSKSLSSINLKWEDVAHTEISKILTLVSANLENLRMYSNDDYETDVVAVDMPKLKKLCILNKSNESVLSLLSCANLQHLKYEETRVPDSGEKLTAFLASTPNLTKLSLGAKATRDLFIDALGVKKINFRLVDLKVNFFSCHVFMSYDNEIYYTNFFNFLKTQRSLKSLTVTAFETSASQINSLLSFELKTLHFNNCHFKWYEDDPIVENALVETLRFEGMDTYNSMIEYGIQCVMESCKSVTAVEFKNVKITLNLSLTIAHRMKKLKKLSLLSCDIEPITFPYLKELKLINDLDFDPDRTMQIVLSNLFLPSIILSGVNQSCERVHDILRVANVSNVKFSNVDL